MFVRWYVFVVSFCTFDFGGSGACADEQTEQHFDTCVVERFDLALPTHTDVCLCSIAYQTFTIADSITQNGEAYGGLGSCRSDHLTGLRSKLPGSRKTATFLVPSLGWYFVGLGE